MNTSSQRDDWVYAPYAVVGVVNERLAGRRDHSVGPTHADGRLALARDPRAGVERLRLGVPRGRPAYWREFRREALELLKLSGKPLVRRETADSAS
jgi:hypothetical protein